MALAICPITQEPFTDPVVAEDGHTYDRQAITRWLASNKTSPMTRELIGPQLVPNVLARARPELEALVGRAVVSGKADELVGWLPTATEPLGRLRAVFGRAGLMTDAVKRALADLRRRRQEREASVGRDRAARQATAAAAQRLGRELDDRLEHLTAEIGKAETTLVWARVKKRDIAAARRELDRLTPGCPRKRPRTVDAADLVRRAGRACWGLDGADVNLTLALATAEAAAAAGSAVARAFCDHRLDPDVARLSAVELATDDERILVAGGLSLKSPAALVKSLASHPVGWYLQAHMDLDDMHGRDWWAEPHSDEATVATVGRLGMAAETGMARALEMFAIAVEYGCGVARDPDRARALHQRAHERGGEIAAFNLALHCARRDMHDEALKWYRLAAERGDGESMHSLAMELRKGSEAGSPDDREGLGWMVEAANLGTRSAVDFWERRRASVV